VELYEEYTPRFAGVNLSPALSQGEGVKVGVEKGVKVGVEKGVKVGVEKGVKVGVEKGVKVGVEKGARGGIKPQPIGDKSTPFVY